jgi:acyl-CoA thioesterase-2
MRLREILEVEPHHGDVFVGTGPPYPWGGLYGGQIMAQALRAACHTVADGKLPHSLHGYFLRGGVMEEAVRYEVERLRDGRSIATRRVVAFQGGEAIATLGASFQIVEEGPDTGTTSAPALPDRETLERRDWGSWVRRHLLPRQDVGRVTAVMEISEPLGDDPVLQACALTFLSDDLPTDAAGMLHPARVLPGASGDWPFFNASLDHAVWFHAPARVDAPHLHDFTGTRLRGGRALTRGEVYDARGVHVATVAQEVLIRPLRAGSRR